MSSGFISGGTSEQPRERNELWQKAEQELEAARQRKLEQKNHDGKSLYEVLQENKAAKQEAFEESVKLKHQFRSLDEDDVSFLNSIRDSETAKERAVQQETSHQLEAFRKQQAGKESPEADDYSAQGPDVIATDETTAWQVVAKKRKREQGKILKGVKVPKVASTGKDHVDQGQTNDVPNTSVTTPTANRSDMQTSKESEVTKPQNEKESRKADEVPEPAVPALGLSGYSSDED